METQPYLIERGLGMEHNCCIISDKQTHLDQSRHSGILRNEWSNFSFVFVKLSDKLFGGMFPLSNIWISWFNQNETYQKSIRNILGYICRHESLGSFHAFYEFLSELSPDSWVFQFSWTWHSHQATLFIFNLLEKLLSMHGSNSFVVETWGQRVLFYFIFFLVVWGRSSHWGGVSSHGYE